MSSASTSTPERFPALPWFPFLISSVVHPERGGLARQLLSARIAFRRLPRTLRRHLQRGRGQYHLLCPAFGGNRAALGRDDAGGVPLLCQVSRDISHEGDLRERLEAAGDFLELLAPLGERVSPLWLQLSAAFTPQRLGELLYFLDELSPRRIAVEVRHPAFFDKGEDERLLNRHLRERGVERICLDSRALFSCRSDDPAVLHAQSKKPRLPIRPAAFSDTPQVRFIGGPDLPANEVFLLPWVDKVADWIEAGLTPYVFLHTPDNHLAAQQAQRFHALLGQRLPGLPALPEPIPAPEVEQLGLL